MKAQHPELTEDQCFEFLKGQIPALWKDGKIIVNINNCRPSEVPFQIAHEALLHDGIRRAFGDEAANKLFDLVWNQFGESEGMRAILKRYGFIRQKVNEKGEFVFDDEGNAVWEGYDQLTRAQKREAAEEFLANLQETNGVPVTEIYADHKAEIDDYAREHGMDPSDQRKPNIDRMAREWMAATGYRPPRPSWLKQLISRIRTWFRQHGWFVNHISDDEILTILARAAKAEVSRRGGKSAQGEGVRYAIDYSAPAEQPKIKFPNLDINNIAQVREYMKRYIGMPVQIKSDGRIATFTQGGNKSSLKRKGINLVAVEALDKVIESSYPVGWVTGDTLLKHQRIFGQYVYVSTFILDANGRDNTGYTAKILLDDVAGEDYAVFKDIEIKKIEPAVTAGLSTGEIPEAGSYHSKEGSYLKIGDVVDKVKAYCEKKYGKHFHDQIPENLAQRQDLLYQRAVEENPEYAQSMAKRAAKRKFSQSKVVDADGKLLPVYHDTNAKIYVNKETGENWDELDWKAREEWEDRDDWDEHWEERDFYTFSRVRARRSIEYPGFFFSPTPDPHHEYGSRRIVAYLNITNPAIDPVIENAGVYDDSGEAAMKKLIEQGYDGVIRTENGKPYEYIAFYPEQIKLADDVTYDDNGDPIPLSQRFDPNNPDVRYSVREFDPTAGNERAKNVVAMLRPLVGRKRSGFDHAKLAAQIKERHGVDVTPVEVAVWLNEAIRQNAGEMARNTAKIRNEWLYENNALWKLAVDYAGSDDFKVRVSERMKDRNLEGTFWLTKKNEKSANTVIDLDALANEVARQTGRDALDVEQEFFDFFNGLTKSNLNEQYNKYRREQSFADKEQERQAREEYFVGRWGRSYFVTPLQKSPSVLNYP